MKKTIIAFAGSNSKTSINKKLVTYASSLAEGINYEVLDLNDYDVPTYSVNIESESGIPKQAEQFYNKLKEGDGFIVSLAEHNGAYTSAFKSLFDWVSRVNVKMFQEKPMLLMSTAPGPRGGQSVFEIAENRFPRHNANLVSKFVLPTFNDNFKDGQIVNQDLDLLLNKAVTTLVDNIK